MKAKETFFSIVVPAFNRKDYLEVLISRLKLIKYSNWELIVVDDGSTDNTDEIFLNSTNDKIKYYRKENAERGAARNYGAKFASGDYITYLDSDDYLLPDVFVIANKIISDNPDIPMFHLGFEVRNSTGLLISNAEILPANLNDIIKERNVIACLGMFLKNNVALEYQFSELRELSGTEDYELWLRLASDMPLPHYNFTVGVLVNHEARSMYEVDTAKLVNRINTFITLALRNHNVLEFLGNSVNKFLSFRYSYIALHAAIAKDRKLSIDYLLKSFIKNPRILFKTRFWVIIRKMIYL
jgi:glycosyltransferase involved in cell wall biosynthesis